MTSQTVRQCSTILLALCISFSAGARSRLQSGEQELAIHLVAARTEEERNAILAAQKQLINVELRKALIGQGAALRTNGSYAQALVIFELASRIAEQINDKAGGGEAWNGVGDIRVLQGNFPLALEGYQKGLVLCEALGEKDCIATSLNGIGNVFISKGDYDVALEHCRKALAISEESGNKKNSATALNRLGVAYYLQGDYALSLDHYRKALSIAEATGDKARAAGVLGNIGNIHRQRGDADLAMEYFQKSLALAELLQDRAGIASGFNNIGIIHLTRGDYGAAMRILQEALAAYEALGNQSQIASALGNMAGVHRLQGNFSLALEYHQKQLKMEESMGQKPRIASILENMGVIYGLQGDYARALEHFQKTLSLREARGDKSGIATSLINIGELYRLQGAYELALVNYRRSLQLTEELGEKGIIAKILAGQGDVYYSRGDYASGAESAERAAALAREGGDRETLWEVLCVASRAHRALGQPGRARQELNEAISTVEALRAQVAGGGQEQQRFFEDRVSPYYEMVKLLAAQDNTGEALTYAERAKARVLLDVLRSGRVNVTKAMTIESKEQEAKIRNTLVSLNTRISNESRRPQADPARLAELNGQLAKARLDQQDFQSRLYAAHPDLRIHRGEMQTFTLEQAGELLTDSSTALLEYAIADDRSFLFVLTAAPRKLQQPVLKLYELKIKRKDLVERVRKLNQRIANNDIEFDAQAKDLYNLLLAPARDQLQGKTRLVIVPDDILWETPFQALRSTTGRFLIQDAAISYAPSLTVLREIGKSRKPKSATTLLAMGNPKLAGQTVARSKNVLMSGSFEPLPDAERMVRELAQIYGAKASKIYVGSEAREEVLKAESRNYRILQLATHGVLNNASPMYSHVVLAQGDETKEDGLLEAWEIMRMDLQADLVVLSACETARGRIGAGEGVIGLSWALFVAGCPTTVVSQWKVESSSTTELMLAFHRHLQAGATKSEAMRQAALKLMADKRYDHPFYWAGFMVVGDGN